MKDLYIIRESLKKSVDDENQPLLDAIKFELPRLKELQKSVNSHWAVEDLVYRFYHHSFKVYNIQHYTREMVTAFRDIGARAGKPKLHPSLEQIILEGTGRSWRQEHNERWLEETRPLIEAFMHAKYFLDQMVQYGESLESAPRMLPSGWAAVLHLFCSR